MSRQDLRADGESLPPAPVPATGARDDGTANVVETLAAYFAANAGRFTDDALERAAADAGHAESTISLARGRAAQRLAAASTAGRRLALRVVLGLDVVGLLILEVLTLTWLSGSGVELLIGQVALGAVVFGLSAWWINTARSIGPVAVTAALLLGLSAFGMMLGSYDLFGWKDVAAIALAALAVIWLLATSERRKAGNLAALLAFPVLLLLVFPGTCVVTLLINR